jgi:hypothetical protein
MSHLPDILLRGGGLLIPQESQLKGEERKRRKKEEEEERRNIYRREGTFTIHLYSFFCEQFLIQNLNNLLVALNMIHTLFAYSLYIFELLENAL